MMKPKIVGLTGGIGSGKTTIAHYFKTLNIPVFISDKEAKLLMNTSQSIQKKLKHLFGDEAYKDQQINKTFLATKIFKNKALLTQINNIIHPEVKRHFTNWLRHQHSPYIIKEAAIIFENNLQSEYDYIITVVANKATRIQRVLKRDASTKEKIEAIMNNQFTDSEKIAQSDFVIQNDNLELAKKQALDIHHTLTEALR